MSKLRSIITFCLVFWAIPHEFGHFIFRKWFGVYTDRWGIGNITEPPAIKIKRFGIGKFSLKCFGANLPLDADRSFLKEYQQILISIAGPSMDLIAAAVCTMPFIRPNHNPWESLLNIPVVLLAWNALGNMHTHYFVSGDGIEHKSDGQKIYDISKRAWLGSWLLFVVAFLILLAVFALSTPLGYLGLIFIFFIATAFSLLTIAKWIWAPGL